MMKNRANVGLGAWLPLGFVLLASCAKRQRRPHRRKRRLRLP